MGDPFALTARDWCQNIDLFCTRCNSYLAHKPYRRSKHELYQKTRCWNFRMQVATERVSFRQISIAAQSRMVIRSSLWLRSGQGGFGGSHAPGGRTLNLAEPDREIYDPSLTSQDQSSILTESHEREALEPSSGETQYPPNQPGERFQHTLELYYLNTTKRQRVEFGSRLVQSTKP